MKGRRELLVALAALLAAMPPYAQPGDRVRRIGILGNIAPVADGPNSLQFFVTALRDLGWIEGKTVTFDYRWAEQHYDRFPALASELVGLGVDLIVVTAGVTAALATKQATTTIPIVAVLIADPVKFGLVASFAHPGGNITGIAQPLAVWGKWLELAREAVPGAMRIAVIGNPTNIVYADYVAQNEAAARQLGLKLQMIPVARADDLAPAFEAMKVAHAEALVVGTDGVYFVNLREIVERARANRLPLIGAFRNAADMGALVTWSFDIRYAFRRAATYADRILRGTLPAELPVEQPSRFELVINLKTAKGLGLTIPQSMLLRADQVIQ
ncbi:ABC transporter substrate-binding protein [Variovorax sp. J22R115]|uniref:ABC transporter substrate-binding protein n=1 Tax=Variovorax sp. J22R115 TaxID=3053509 RepID=UPI0025759328|nr:ABC transporter substrate-binding protein [Variovorax sp. J22R115]MDM0047572.1 ABC transporter substrate-binding protein [Variovorax sp. J22R115]